MEPKAVLLQNKGMWQDASISKQPEGFAFENYGIRITESGDNTELSITNERGPKNLLSLKMGYIAHCIISDYIIIFAATSKASVILRVTINNGEASYYTLYEGNLGFDGSNYKYQIECLPWYESEQIQKVYWCDGVNPARVINVAPSIDETRITSGNDYQFDFSGIITKIPNVDIEKDYNIAGMFNQGTIQYFVTAYNLYGQETSIIWMSSIQYISYKDRGAKADENVSCGFRISVTKDSFDYDYLRVYAVQRTSLDSQATLRVVGDIAIKGDKVNNNDTSNTISIIDNGTTGYSADADLLYYIGGSFIIPGTITQKDGVMFMGDIQTSEEIHSAYNELKEYIHTNCIDNLDNLNPNTIRSSKIVSFDTKEIEMPVKEGYYVHKQQIDHSEYNIATYKNNEIYRFALQFMDHYGQWTDPIWVGDKLCTQAPSIIDNKAKVANAVVTNLYSDKDCKTIFDKYNIVAYRLLYAETSASTRSVVAQGVVNPTLFNYYERYNNTPYSFPSWNFRPRFSGMPDRHLDNIAKQDSEYAEIQGVTESADSIILVKKAEDDSNYKYYAFILGFDSGHEIIAYYIRYNLTPRDANYNDVTSSNDIQAYVDRLMSGQQALNKKDSNGNIIADYDIQSVYIDRGSWNNALSDLITKAEEWAKLTSEESDVSLPFSLTSIPSKSEVRKIITKLFFASFNEIAKRIGGFAQIAITSVIPTSLIAATALIAANDIYQKLCAYETTDPIKMLIGMSTIGGQIVQQEASKVTEIERLMANKGWLPLGTLSNLKENTYNLSKLFPTIFNEHNHTFKGNDNNSMWITGGVMTYKTTAQLTAENNRDQYFVDENIVTLNSPDLDGNEDILENNQNIKFRIVGDIPISAVYADALIETSSIGFNPSAGILDLRTEYNQQLDSNDVVGLVNAELYQDSSLEYTPATSGKEASFFYRKDGALVKYKTFLWNRNTSFSIGGGHSTDYLISGAAQSLTSIAEPKKKIFANIRFSYSTQYFDSLWTPQAGASDRKISLYNDDKQILLIDDDIINPAMYSGNYDNIVTFTNEKKYPILTSDYPGVITQNEDLAKEKVFVADPIRIKFSTTQHAIINLGSVNGTKKCILPKFNNESSFKYQDRHSDTKNDFNNSDYVYNLGETNTSPGAFLGTYWIPYYYSIHKTKFEFSSSEYVASGIDENTIQLTGDAIERFENYILTYVVSDGTSTTIGTVIVSDFFNHNKYCLVLPIRITDTGEQYAAVVSYPPIKSNPEIYLTKLNLSDGTRINGKKIQYVFLGNILICTAEKVYTYSASLMDFVIYDKNSTIVSESNIELDNPSLPYLFIGELYQDLDYKILYGGYSDEALKLITWLPCSGTRNISEDIKMSYGDTYYQRWDCLKSYPTTEEDVNSIVDILSFMVETHKNLDGRCDVNRGVHNILNARPSNWNLMNGVYNQKDNLFKYNIVEKKLESTLFKNQIVWSLSKQDTADIDTWTNINLATSLSLDGRYGAITKLDTLNNSLISFQERAISGINFNNRTQLSTEQGLPVELANTGKVDGYTIISDNIGCSDKNSITHGGSGIYFIDKYNKAFFRFNKEGIENLGVKGGMSNYIKERIPDYGIRTCYDALTNDIYLYPTYLRKDVSPFAYNEKTGSFTSFYPYLGMKAIFAFNGSSYLINQYGVTYMSLGQMFVGDYGIYNYFNNFNATYPYYMDFKVNPEPFEDKIFTNIDYVADTFDKDSKADVQSELKDDLPFNKLTIWNEYQKGECSLKENFKPWKVPSSNRTKFRIRHIELPRDSTKKLDRIRNPWCRIKLQHDSPTVSTEPLNKMIFHYASVKYYK